MALVQLLLELLHKAFVEDDGADLLIDGTFSCLDRFVTFD